MTNDPMGPYGEPEQEGLDDARVVTPQTPKRNPKAVRAALVLFGLIMSAVIIANIAGVVNNRTSNAKAPAKPLTMTRNQSDQFAQQQSGQANWLRGMDRDAASRKTEDIVLGYGKDLAADSFEEADGVPKKTQAQDDAEHGRNTGQGQKSEAEQLRERMELEAQHRRQNDLDSSPMALDFSDYFAKDKPRILADGAPASPAALSPATSNREVGPIDPPSAPAGPTTTFQRHRSALADALAAEEQESAATIATEREPHDPAQDYVFDSSFGKLYRLMEDTILETVLVNRLAGASIGPVIAMVTTDVYSTSGSHLLIPQGTRLLGTVSAVASTNQERLFVAFHRMIYPDGYSVSLDKFKGLDVVGQTGLRDLVNHHYVQIFGTSIALAAVAATTQIGNNSSLLTYDWGSQMRNGVSQGLGQSAQRVMERFMNILPTFTIRERSRVKIMLASDMLLPDTKNHTMDPDL